MSKKNNFLIQNETRQRVIAETQRDAYRAELDAVRAEMDRIAAEQKAAAATQQPAPAPAAPEPPPQKTIAQQWRELGDKRQKAVFALEHHRELLESLAAEQK